MKVIDGTTIVFPGFDGNGMFLSTGNIMGQGKVGLLFIDFETPNRLRVQGTARLLTDDPSMGEHTGAQYLVRIDVAKVWVNCPRYIHKYSKGEQSRYVPRTGSETPLASWKRLEMVQDVLTPEDLARVEAEGIMPMAEYQDRVARGDS